MPDRRARRPCLTARPPARARPASPPAVPDRRGARAGPAWPRTLGDRHRLTPDPLLVRLTSNVIGNRDGSSGRPARPGRASGGGGATSGSEGGRGHPAGATRELLGQRRLPPPGGGRCRPPRRRQPHDAPAAVEVQGRARLRRRVARRPTVFSVPNTGSLEADLRGCVDNTVTLLPLGRGAGRLPGPHRRLPATSRPCGSRCSSRSTAVARGGLRASSTGRWHAGRSCAPVDPAVLLDVIAGAVALPGLGERDLGTSPRARRSARRRILRRARPSRRRCSGSHARDHRAGARRRRHKKEQ